MNTKPSTKFEFPKGPTLSRSTITDLITEAVPSSAIKLSSGLSVDKSFPEKPESKSLPLADNTKSKKTAAKMQVAIEYSVLREAKIRAAQESSTLSNVVEKALCAYLKI